jgi:predicted esterase
MLEKLFVVIPNIDRKRTFMGGFSNGAHTTAILINSEENKIAKYFKNFFFIEGGNRLAEFKRIKKSSLLFMQGAKNNRNWLEAVFTKSQQEKIQSEFIKMEGYGHDFPEEYYQHLIDWIKMN